MPQQILFVDYENVGEVNLDAIPAGVLVPFFFGAAQKSVPRDFMKAALKLGERFIPIDIEGHGSNALDFHIAFYLGEFLSKNAAAECIILSKDKGFDPLMRHLRNRKFSVRRATSLAEAFHRSRASTPAPVQPRPAQLNGESPAPQPSPLELAAKWLKETPPRERPRKRKSLIAYLNTRFGNKLKEPELAALVDKLIAQEKLTDFNGALSYLL